MKGVRLDPRLLKGIERDFKEREPALHAILNRWEAALERRDRGEELDHVCAGPGVVCQRCGRYLDPDRDRNLK